MATKEHKFKQCLATKIVRLTRPLIYQGEKTKSSELNSLIPMGPHNFNNDDSNLSEILLANDISHDSAEFVNMFRFPTIFGYYIYIYIYIYRRVYVGQHFKAILTICNTHDKQLKNLKVIVIKMNFGLYIFYIDNSTKREDDLIVFKQGENSRRKINGV